MSKKINTVGKQSVFLKSVFRQRVRTLLFFIIICAAAFAFVMRTSEYMLVRDRVYAIAEGFRSIGFLHINDKPYGNIIEGAEIVRNSSYVSFEDRRRGFEAVMHDGHNTNFGGLVGGGGHVQTGMEVSHISIPEREVHSYFYGILEHVAITNTPAVGHFVELRFHIDDVEAGYSEHTYDGHAESHRINTNHRVRWYMDLDATDNPLENMVIGERYFVCAALYWVSSHGRGMLSNPPMLAGGGTRVLYMHPLNDEGLLYIHAPEGRLDFAQLGLENISTDIERMNYNTNVLWLRTTADMQAMPAVQEGVDRLTLARGRLLDHDDYLNARPVAVIHQFLAMYRGIDIGDTITVSIPSNQRIADLHTVMLFGQGSASGFLQRRENFIFSDGFLDFAVVGDPADFIVEELELEVVGTFNMLSDSRRHMWSGGYLDVLLSNYVFIPDSLLPQDFMPVDELHGNDQFLWDVWYSFEISDTRNEIAFLRETREALDELGLSANIIPTSAANFWTSAEPILISATINAVMFIIVMVLLFGLVSFLYLGQRKRDFAILRALGNPGKRTVWQLFTPAVIFLMPAIVIGGVLGWFFAMSEAAGTLEAFEDFAVYAHEAEALPEISVLWLALLIGLMSLMVMLMIYIGAVRMTKRPVLTLLQGVRAKASDTVTVADQVLGTPSTLRLQEPLRELQGAASAKKELSQSGDAYTSAHSANGRVRGRVASINSFYASVQFAFRHIRRAPMKTALTAATAIIFIAAMGLLQQSMANTESEVNRLYDTTIVSGEIVSANQVLNAERPDILHLTFNSLMEADFFQSHYAEAHFSDFFLIHPDEDGNFPQGEEGEFWDEFWFHIRHELYGNVGLRIDPIFAFSDYDNFMDVHGEQQRDIVPGMASEALFDFEEMGLGVVAEPIEIHYGEGFSRADFVYDDPTLTAPIPVILSDLTLVRRELEVGDEAFLGHYFPGLWWGSEIIEAPVRVIGWHNGSIGHPLGRNAVLLPMPAFESMLGNRMSYSTLNFEIAPEYNRELDFLRLEIQRLLRIGAQGATMSLSFTLDDEELRVVAGQMERNLTLMLLLYPVVIAVSVVIGAGLAFLLLLQSEKIAAILRVLGYGKTRTRTMLSTEHVIVALVGVIFAFILMPIVGIVFTNQLPMLAGLYVLGAVAGAVSGGVIITRRAPLELLQVKE